MIEKDNKVKQAVALSYNAKQDNAPRVIAKGQGYIADKILETGQGHQIPVYQNQGLANMLMAVELDKEIPAELYQAVAQVLVYIYQMDQSKAKARNIPY